MKSPKISPSIDPLSSPLPKLIKKQFQRRFSSNNHLLLLVGLLFANYSFPGCFIIKKKILTEKIYLLWFFSVLWHESSDKRKIVEAKTFLIKFGNMKNLLWKLLILWCMLFWFMCILYFVLWKIFELHNFFFVLEIWI